MLSGIEIFNFFVSDHLKRLERKIRNVQSSKNDPENCVCYILISKKKEGHCH